jgi:hypothetical protein
MRQIRVSILGVFLMLISNTTLAAASLEKCKATLAKFRELGSVPELLAQSYGYAVLPTIGKGGIGIGGAGGTGCVFAGGRHTGKVSMGQITIGWQLGGMAVFTLAKGGLMYEASIGGQKFKFKPLGD